MKYTIRLIEEKDNQAVEQVIRSCLIEFHANHKGTAWEDSDLGKFYSIYQKQGHCYYVVEDEVGNIVGGAGIGLLDEEKGICELQKMYCLPVIRGTTVTHQLMEKVLSFAKKHYQVCYLETLKQMVAANKFYQKYGFVSLMQPLVLTSHNACDVWYRKDL